MNLLYANEHFSCRNYDKGPKSSIQLKKITGKAPFQDLAVHGKIVFLLHGKISYSYGSYYNCPMREKQMLFLPPNNDFVFSSKDEAEILLIRLSNKVQFCESYSLETLTYQTLKKQNGMDRKEKVPFLLEMNEDVENYVSNLLSCMSKGLLCKYYFETKIKELFYLLRAFYYKEDLALFFKDILSPDTSFSQFVMHNHHKYKTLSEMADDMGMSLSNIEKLFSKVFNVSGYKWMNKQKADKIYHALCTEKTPLKEIAMRFEFSSASSLNDFCKNMLGDTPGMIRKKVQSEQNDE